MLQDSGSYLGIRVREMLELNYEAAKVAIDAIYQRKLWHLVLWYEFWHRLWC